MHKIHLTIMKHLIHEIVTSIKYLYPCIAYEESFTDKEIVILTETKLDRVYPVKKTVQGMISIGEDYWGRFTFKDDKDQYYCEVDGVLHFKGNDMEGEPDYPVKKQINYDFPEIDNEFSNFNPFIEKAKKYFSENNYVELLETTTSIQKDSNNILNSKIILNIKRLVLTEFQLKHVPKFDSFFVHGFKN